MTDYDKKLDKLVRLLGEIVNAEAVDSLQYHMKPKRPHVAYELTAEGSTVRACVEQYALDCVTEYVMRNPSTITMLIKYTDQPIFDELVGDLWDKAYHQGIEDERNAAALDLGIGANRVNPYRSR